jgi:hypothetical protein
MAVEIRQLKDKGTDEPFVPVTAWEAIGNKPDVATQQDLNDLLPLIYAGL